MKTLPVLCVVAAFASTLPAQVPSDSAIRALIATRVDAGRFAGVAVGVVGRDGVRRTVAYGPDAGVQPFDASTVFEIGSITKTFTTAILADMVKRGNTANSVDEIGFHLLDPSFPLPSLPKRRVEVPLSEATLERYVGTFELAPTFTIVITRDGAQLSLQATGQPRFPLFAEKEDEFFLKVVDAQVTFTKDGAGAVTGLVLHQNGAHQPAKKKP